MRLMMSYIEDFTLVSASHNKENVYSPLDGMLVHHRLLASILSGCPNKSLVLIYTLQLNEAQWAFKSVLPEERNIMSTAKA